MYYSTYSAFPEAWLPPNVCGGCLLANGRSRCSFGDCFENLSATQDAHSLEESVCPSGEDGGVSPCLADGVLIVVLNGKEGDLLAPSTVLLAPDVIFDAANLPGACRYTLVLPVSNR